MNESFDRVVTTISAAGRAVFAEDSPIDFATAPGVNIHTIWGTADGIPTVGAGVEPELVEAPFFPGPGGHRVLIGQFLPSRHGGESTPEAEADAVAQAPRVQPGLLEAFGSEVPGFHATDTIDYAFCIDGEVWLVLDGGEERLITPGTFTVQRGTRHAWQNRTDRPCTMLFVVLGAERR